MAIGSFSKYGVDKVYGRQINWGHPLAQGLAACWQFAEGGGSIIYDSARYGNGVFGTGAGILPKWRSRAPESGMLGTDVAESFATVPNNSGVPLGGRNQLTLQFRCFLYGLPGSTAPVISKDNPASGYPSPFFVSITSAGEGVLVTGSGLFTQETTNSGSNQWVVDTWTDSVCTCNLANTTAAWYKNGVARGNNTALAHNLGDEGDSIVINGTNTSSTITGYMLFSYVRIWNRVLSPAEILWLYAEPNAFFLPAAPVKRFWGGVPPSILYINQGVEIH